MKQSDNLTPTQPQINSAVDQNEIAVQRETMIHDFLIVTCDGPKRLSLELTFDAPSKKIIEVDYMVKAQRPDLEKRTIRAPMNFASCKSNYEVKAKERLPVEEIYNELSMCIDNYNKTLKLTTPSIS